MHVVCRSESVGIQPFTFYPQSGPSYYEQQAGKGSQCEDGRQQMHQLKGARVTLHQIDASNAAIVNLFEELLEIRSALMPDPCLGEKTTTCSTLVDTDTEVDVLTESHLRETTQLLIERPADTHIKGTGIELLVHLFLAAAYATGSEEGRHAVVNGFLHIGETVVGTVGTAEGRDPL